MTIYFIYYFSIFFIAIVARPYTDRKKTYCFLCCTLLTLILALRSPSMGADLGIESTYGYLHSYQLIGEMSFETIFRNKIFLNYEFGYILFNKLLYLISPNVELLIIACAILSIVPVFILLYFESNNSLISIVVYLSLGLFLISFSGLRQGIAIGICCIATLFIKRRKILPFILFIILATLFHRSAIVYIFAYPFFRIKKNWCNVKYFPVLFVSLIFMFVFRRSIFELLCRFFNQPVFFDDNGAYRYFIFLLLIFSFLLLFSKQQEQGWITLVYISCIIQIFSGLNSLVMRAGYYYQIGLLIAIPNTLSKIDKPKERILFEFIISILFVGYGLYAISSTKWAQAAPYHFFWDLH